MRDGADRRPPRLLRATSAASRRLEQGDHRRASSTTAQHSPHREAPPRQLGSAIARASSSSIYPPEPRSDRERIAGARGCRRCSTTARRRSPRRCWPYRAEPAAAVHGRGVWRDARRSSTSSATATPALIARGRARAAAREHGELGERRSTSPIPQPEATFRACKLDWSARRAAAARRDARAVPRAARAAPRARRASRNGRKDLTRVTIERGRAVDRDRARRSVGPARADRRATCRDEPNRDPVRRDPGAYTSSCSRPTTRATAAPRRRAAQRELAARRWRAGRSMLPALRRADLPADARSRDDDLAGDPRPLLSAAAREPVDRRGRARAERAPRSTTGTSASTASATAPTPSRASSTATAASSSIVNNYEHISFNFGPTLLSWLEQHDPDTLRADPRRRSRQRAPQRRSRQRDRAGLQPRDPAAVQRPRSPHPGPLGHRRLRAPLRPRAGVAVAARDRVQRRDAR